MQDSNIKTKIAVVVPAYNAARTLERCLDSLARQTYADFEVIAVDDGSTDGSAEIIEEYAARDGRFKAIKKENGGAARARNYALDRLSGDTGYITFLDADDWMDRDTLEVLYELINKTGADIAECGFRYEYPNGSGFAPAPLFADESVFKRSEFKNTVCRKILTSINLNHVCHVLFRAEAVRGARMPEDMRTGEDLMYVLEVLKNAEAMAYTGRPFYHYYIHDDSITGTGLPVSERLRCNLRISKKIASYLKYWDMDTPFYRTAAYLRIAAISASKAGRIVKNKVISLRGSR